jgi:ribosome-interacting GTPase 1
MMGVRDVLIQLIDLPSISSQHPIPWIANALQPADGALLVVDLSVPGCVEVTAEVHDILEERRIHLLERWPVEGSEEESRETFDIYLPTLVVATKSDLIPNAKEELDVFLELEGYHYASMTVSAETGEGLEEMGGWLFDRLGIVRVYSKEPGSPPDTGAPFTVRRGDTVIDVAEQVHRDFVRDFKYARVWGGSGFEGQQVGRDHPVVDGDIIELHT